MNLTDIEWADYTSNPGKFRSKETGKIVWACVHAAPGCIHCYAETLAKRYGRGLRFTAPNMAKVDAFID